VGIVAEIVRKIRKGQSKTMALFCIGTLLFGSCLISVQGEDNTGISVGEVLSKIEKIDDIRVVGEDFISAGRDRITDRTAVLDAIGTLNFDKLRKMIAEETDYECLAGKDYVIMIPKDDPSMHDLALSKRMVVFPDATNVPINQFLAKIKSMDPANFSVYLGGPLMFESQAGGSISIKGGQGICYQVLNALARQLKARSWRIQHLDFTDPKSGKFILPLKLGAGSVSFFARPSLSWISVPLKKAN
jgi:hypothetical protein